MTTFYDTDMMHTKWKDSYSCIYKILASNNQIQTQTYRIAIALRPLKMFGWSKVVLSLFPSNTLKLDQNHILQIDSNLKVAENKMLQYNLYNTDLYTDKPVVNYFQIPYI